MGQSNRNGKKKHRLRSFILFLLLVAIIGLAVWYGYIRLKTEYTVTYDTYTASKGSISNSLSFSGNMQLIDSNTYTAEGSAKVRQLYIEEGDEVRDGEKLMRLSDGQVVEADFDGRVNTLSVKKDDDVKPGDELVQIADFDHMKIAIRIDEYDISEVHVGDACTVTMTASEKKFDSSIAKINYISASGGTVAYYAAECYVDVAGEEIYPGMQASVEIVREEANDVVILKVDALSFDFKNSAFVYMQDENGGMIETPVTVGVSNGNYCEIKDGIKDGDTVYAVAKQQETPNPFASMFASTQINQPRGNRGDFSGGRPGGYDGGSGGWNGGSGSSGRSNGGSGNSGRPSGNGMGGGMP